MRGVLNFFLRFRSELATDEIVLHGTIRLDSKIRSENVHFHDSFWRGPGPAGAGRGRGRGRGRGWGLFFTYFLCLFFLSFNPNSDFSQFA